MTIDQKITPFPSAIPSRQDSESFSTRMDDTLTHFGVIVPELNIMIDQANNYMTATANEAADSARRALDSETGAASSAALAEIARQNAQAAAAGVGYQGDYSSLATYSKGHAVSYNSMLFISKINGNLGNTPQDGANWAAFWVGRPTIMRYL